MANPDAPLPRVSPGLAALLRIAAGLRGLPSAEFRTRLKAELTGTSRAGKASRATSTSLAPSRAGEQSKAARKAKPIPQQFHSITPFLIVDQVAETVDFLKQAFGAVETMREVGGDPPHMHAEVKIGDSMVMLGEGAGKLEPMPTAFHLYVKNSDAVYQRALQTGASPLHGPTDQDYGDREASVKDPFGNHWYIGTHKQGGSYVPAGLRSVTPYLHPKGTAKVIDFLKRVFDAEEVFRAEGPDGTIHHAKIRIGDSMLEMGEAHGPYQPMPPAIYLNVSDVDETYRRALRARATSVQEPADKRYGDRNAGVKDPFGNVWFIAKHLENAPQAQSRPQAKEEPPIETNPAPHAVMPFIYIKGADKAADFYTKVLGATEMMRLKQPSGVVSHVQIKVGESRFMIRDPGTPDLAEYRAKGYAISAKDLGGTPVHLYLYVEDADAVFQRALDAGSKVTEPIRDTEWGDRCGGIQDPFGQIWYIATPLKPQAH